MGMGPNANIKLRKKKKVEILPIVGGGPLCRGGPNAVNYGIYNIIYITNANRVRYMYNVPNCLWLCQVNFYISLFLMEQVQHPTKT